MKSESGDYPIVLLPEEDPVLDELKSRLSSEEDYHKRLGAYVHFDPMTLEDAAGVLKKGEVAVVIGGLVADSASVLRTAIRHVNRSIDPGNKDKITSFFVMERNNASPIYLADCAVYEQPDASTLFTIAEHTAQSVKDLGVEPVVAFLSLSTFGSAEHLESTKKVKEVAERFKKEHPEILSYGEIQADAAINKRIFEKKAQKAGVELVGGKMPNVFILPDGVSGNIVYKMLEQLAGHVAVGPLLNGVTLDFHDLSRGATAYAVERSIYYAALLHSARKARRK